ncbi:MAG TPA: hypothetical protein VHV26_15700 [Rhizomicrobium sp.]|nr:hypothetical protein [Rhizomicrobium sp.]
MMEHSLSQLSRLFGLRSHEPIEVAPDPDYHRSTAPDARMNLLLRFDTPLGPRTIVTSGIPLTFASEITAAMIRSGQYAEFIDQCQPLTVAERVKRKKMERARAPKQQTNVVGWERREKIAAKDRPEVERRNIC